MSPDPRFVSEPIEPLPGRFETRAMVRGEPGLPEGFRWRGETYRIACALDAGKGLSRAPGEKYVHRHTFRLRMDDGATWNVYVKRRPPIGWFLKTIER